MKTATLASSEAFMSQPRYLVYYDKYRGGMIYMKTHTGEFDTSKENPRFYPEPEQCVALEST